MDFVFDRTAEARSIKSLTVVDDATHEAVALVPERALGGNQLVCILEQLRSTRGLLKAIRTDNGKEFCSRAMLTWAHARSVQLFLIEPGKPNQNAYIESFNGRFCDECLTSTASQVCSMPALSWKHGERDTTKRDPRNPLED